MERSRLLVMLVVVGINVAGLAATATQADVLAGGTTDDANETETVTRPTTGETTRNATTTVGVGTGKKDSETPTTTQPGGDGDGPPTQPPTPDEGDEPGDGATTADDGGGTQPTGDQSPATGTDQPPADGTPKPGPATPVPGTATVTPKPGNGTNDGDAGGGDTGGGDGTGDGDGTGSDDGDGDGTGSDDGDGDGTDDGDGDGSGDGTDDGDGDGSGDGTGDDDGDGTGDGDDDGADDGNGDDTDGEDEEEELATVEGEPDVSVFAPNRTFSPGEKRELVVQVVNSGTVETTGSGVDSDEEDRVTTARNVQVTLDTDGTPVEGRTGTVSLGDVESGETIEAGFEVLVPADADSDTYDLDVDVEYEVESVDEDGDVDRDTETVTEDVELVVTDRARFEVESVDTGVQVGARDTVEVEFENVGEEDVTDAAVTLTSVNENLQVDGSNEAERFVGDWDAGEDKEVEFQVNATNNSAPQDYAVRANVTYTDDDGTRRRSRPLVFGVTPDEEQEFELDDVDGDLAVGEEGTISGDVENEGPEPASDAVLRIESPDEDVVPLREEFVLGDFDEGDDEEFTFPVRVTEDAEPGDRQFEFTVLYLDENGDPRASDRLLAAVEVDDEPDEFELVNVGRSLQAETNGTVALTLRNERDEDLSETRVSLSSPNPDLQISGSENASRFVGAWEEGEERTVRFPIELTNGSRAQSYPLTVEVAYTDEDGDRNRSEPLRFGVTPAGEQQFRISNVTSTLSVSDEGVVRGRLSNLGPRNVSNVVLQLRNASQNLDARENEFAADGLAAGNSTRFSFPIDVRDNAEPGPRQVTFRVEYRDDEGDLQRSDTIPLRVVVGPETDEFAITTVDNRVAVGSTETVTVRIRNRRNVTLRNINAQVFVTDPLSTDDDEAFVARLDPNESVRLTFDVSASEGATTKTLPLKLDFQYDEPDGETTLSDTYQVGVTVTESEGGLLSDLLSVTPAVVGLLVPIAGVYLWRRRRE